MADRYTLQWLRSLSDDELVAEHDRDAQQVGSAVDYYLRELARREADRRTEAIQDMTEKKDMTHKMVVLTVFISVLTLTNVILVALN